MLTNPCLSWVQLICWRSTTEDPSRRVGGKQGREGRMQTRLWFLAWSLIHPDPWEALKLHLTVWPASGKDAELFFFHTHQSCLWAAQGEKMIFSTYRGGGSDAQEQPAEGCRHAPLAKSPQMWWCKWPKRTGAGPTPWPWSNLTLAMRYRWNISKFRPCHKTPSTLSHLSAPFPVNTSPQTLLFLFKIIPTILGPLHFHINFKISKLISTKNFRNFNWDFVDQKSSWRELTS